MPRAKFAAPLLLTLASGSVVADEGIFMRHAVVSQDALASDVGRDILRSGGNAIDAAVATAFALAVTHPAAGNIGGGGFIVAFDAKQGRVTTFDFREKAPLAANARMYLDESGELVKGHRAGPRAAGVPGTVRGLALAHAKLGSKPWRELVEPAVKLATTGFAVPEGLAESLNSQLFDTDTNKPLDGSGTDARLANFPESVAAFRKSDATPWVAGDKLVQPDLGRTLQRIANKGPDEFYLGETARLIAQDMEARHGLITLEDLKQYQAIERPPVRGTFHGHEVFSVGPPSSGGAVLLMCLNMLEPFDLKADGAGSAKTVHRVTEAMRRAFYQRARELADPDFVDVPIEQMISKPFAKELSRSINGQATDSLSLAEFPIRVVEGGDDTTHLSTIDEQGNAVALTYTLEQGYGSKAMVPGAGFLLNNEMGDFNLVPGDTTTAGRIGTGPNQIEAAKRMLSSQTPIVILKDGKVRLVTGSPGGRTIPNTVLWVVLQVLEFGQSARNAVDAPRTRRRFLEPRGRCRSEESWAQDRARTPPRRRPHDRRRPQNRPH
jgi:gamma-glutamyltranspeptidase / glutathione hydrolase